MIELEDVSIGFTGKVLLRNVSASIADGEATALIGRNGSGKSTLLRAVASLNNDYKGKISVSGRDIRHIAPVQIAKLLAFVNTERIRIPDFSCLQVVAMGRSPHTSWSGKLSADDIDIALQAIEWVGMSDYISRNMDTMSDGECQRIMIARALAQDTPNILLDEPTSFLDLPNRYELVRLLRSIAEKSNKCIFFSTHELDIAMKFCHRIALLESGQLHIETPSSLATSTLLKETFSIPL